MTVHIFKTVSQIIDLLYLLTVQELDRACDTLTWLQGLSLAKYHILTSLIN